MLDNYKSNTEYILENFNSEENVVAGGIYSTYEIELDTKDDGL